MGTLSLTPPSIGSPNSTEDVDIVNAFIAIQTFVNGANFGTAQIEALAITTGLLAANAVTAAKIEAQQAWQALTISGTGIPSQTLNYYKDSLGLVHFRGDMFTSNANTPNGTTFGTMPAGYRPGVTIHLFGAFNGGTGSSFPIMFSISTAGVLTMEAGAFAWSTTANWTVGGICYRAEN